MYYLGLFVFIVDGRYMIPQLSEEGEMNIYPLIVLYRIYVRVVNALLIQVQSGSS